MSILIQLSEAAQSFVDEQVVSGRFSSSSEYIIYLVEQARRAAVRDRIDQLLLEGLNSGPPIEVTPEYWQQKSAEWSEKYDRVDKP